MANDDTIEAACTSRDLFIHHIGVRDDDLRMVLADSTGVATTVMEVQGLRAHHVRSFTATEPILARSHPPGSFGWWLGSDEREKARQVEVVEKRTGRLIMVVLGFDVSWREVDSNNVDLNYPG